MTLADAMPFVNLTLLIALAVWTRYFVKQQEREGIDQIKSELPALVIEALLARAEWHEQLRRQEEAETRLNVLEHRIDRHLDLE